MDAGINQLVYIDGLDEEIATLHKRITIGGVPHIGSIIHDPDLDETLGDEQGMEIVKVWFLLMPAEKRGSVSEAFLILDVAPLVCPDRDTAGRILSHRKTVGWDCKV
jgi:hypothetical protein